MQESAPENIRQHRRANSSNAALPLLEGVYKQAGGCDLVMVRLRAPGDQWKSGGLEDAAAIARDSGDAGLHFTI